MPAAKANNDGIVQYSNDPLVDEPAGNNATIPAEPERSSSTVSAEKSFKKAI